MIYEDDEAIESESAESDTTSHVSGGGSLAMAVIAGAAIGAAVALMLAPRTGRDMRRAIRRRADGLRASAGSAIDDTTEELSRELRRRGRQLRRKLDRMA